MGTDNSHPVITQTGTRTVQRSDHGCRDCRGWTRKTRRRHQGCRRRHGRVRKVGRQIVGRRRINGPTRGKRPDTDIGAHSASLRHALRVQAEMRNVNKKSDLFAEPFLEAKSVWCSATGVTGSPGVGNHTALQALLNRCPVLVGLHVPLVEVDRAPFVASDVASCFGLRAVKGG